MAGDKLGVGICAEKVKRRNKCKGEEQQQKKKQEEKEEARHHLRHTAQLDLT